MRKFKIKPTGRPRLPRLTVEAKRCATCCELREAAMFYKQSSSRDGLTSDCKPCRNDRVRRYREAHSDKISERRRAAYRENPEKYIVRTIEWQRQNPDKMAQKAKRYTTSDRGRERIRVNRQRRIATLKSAIVPDSILVTSEWFASVIDRQGGACLYCGQISSLEMEHVEPISRGGLHIRDNIVAACSSCNASKGAKFLLEWRIGR
jgi:5-methylcytosine-specific restriction endonuclease McrA